MINTLSPLPDVEYDLTEAELGQRLFFDKRLSGPITVPYSAGSGSLGDVDEVGKIACASCHIPETWFIDTRSNPNATSLGAGWHKRNAPTLVNAIYQESFPWSGAFETIAELMRGPLLGDTLMNSSADRIAQVLSDHYQPDYDSLFPDTPLPDPLPECFIGLEDKDKLADCPEADRLMLNVGYILEAYQRRLISRNAPFDRFVAGDADAISESAKRGLRLFIGDALCIECHHGPTFSDGEFHRLGLPDDDEGREDGKFRTAALRTVAETAPYMHDGRLATLTDVVELYWVGGGDEGSDHPAVTPLDLSPDDIRDLVAFLETLTGEPIPDELTDDPFEE